MDQVKIPNNCLFCHASTFQKRTADVPYQPTDIMTTRNNSVTNKCLTEYERKKDPVFDLFTLSVNNHSSKKYDIDHIKRK